MSTATLTSGPANIGEGMKCATYEVLLDTTYAAGGEPVDLTGEFTYVTAMIPAGNDTAADNTYYYSCLCPDHDTAASTTNCLVQLHASPTGTSGEVFIEAAAATDLSTVGNLKLVVFGK